MFSLFCFLLAILASPFKSKSRLEAENAALRHQLVVLRRKMRGRVRLTNSDRMFFIQLYRWFPSVLKVITVIRPDTLVRWHRAGFRWYWRWKSRSFGGRPQIDTQLRALIRRMSVENPLWGVLTWRSMPVCPLFTQSGHQVRNGLPRCDQKIGPTRLRTYRASGENADQKCEIAFTRDPFMFFGDTLDAVARVARISVRGRNKMTNFIWTRG